MEETTKKKLLPESVVKILPHLAIGLGALVLGLVLGLFVLGGGPSTIEGFVTSIESKALSLVPGDTGPVFATLEGQSIRKKIVDQQMEMFFKLNSQRISAEDQAKMRTSREFIEQLVQNIVMNRVILAEVGADPAFSADREFWLYLSISLTDTIQKYYLNKKIGDSVSTEVSDKDIGDAYDQIKDKPEYKERLGKIPFDQIKVMLKQEILQRRSQLRVREHMEKVKGKYRIVLNEQNLPQATERKLENKTTK